MKNKISVIIKLVLIFHNIPVFAQDMQNNSIFIDQQKRNEEAVIAPYKNEVAELARTAQHNAQAPAIQAYIQQLQTKRGNIPLSPLQNERASGQVFIFISSSMPQTSLIQWFNQAEKIHASLIIRGFVNNSLPQTKKWVEQLTAQNNKKGGVEIDPRMFDRYHIEEVPAVVVTNNASYCPPTMSCMPPGFDVVYGNVSLPSALRSIAERGTTNNLVAKQKLIQFEENNQ